MTQVERDAINSDLCAQGLQAMLKKYGMNFSYKEISILFGAISLLYDCPYDEWVFKSTDGYEKWDPFSDPKPKPKKHLFCAQACGICKLTLEECREYHGYGKKEE